MASTQSSDPLAALAERVQFLEDQAALYRLVFSWGAAADTGDSEAAAGIWTDDGVLEVEGAPLEGRSAIFDMIASQGQQDLVSQGCAHVQGFPVVRIDGDRATATNYSRVYLHDDRGYGVWRVTANNWEFRRTADGWRIARRRAHVIDGSPAARELLSRTFYDPAPDPTS